MGIAQEKLTEAELSRAAATLIGGEHTAAEICAKKVSGHGGVKTTMLSGLLFHHKYDKNGQQDTFAWFFRQKLGQDVAYPGTSSIHYQ